MLATAPAFADAGEDGRAQRVTYRSTEALCDSTLACLLHRLPECLAVCVVSSVALTHPHAPLFVKAYGGGE